MVVVRIWEGLGNQLFQYAYARALQLRTGQRVYIDCHRCFAPVLEGRRVKREYALDHFRIKLKACPGIKHIFFFLRNRTCLERFLFFLSQRRFAFVHFYQEEFVTYKKELKNLHGSYYVMGWFQNEKYFREYRKELLEELRIKKKVILSAEIKECLEHQNTVSVHVRRGDYKKQYNALPVDYYVRAVKEMESKIEDPYYIVFSDDMTWAKENLNFLENCFYVSKDQNLRDYEELMLMSRCRHHIIANSTFSWWGAWLNTNEEKIVVGPRQWFAGTTNSHINIMPDEWIKV